MIKLAIVGYGNLGKGVELGLRQCPDISLVGVYTRRDPNSITTLGAPVFKVSDLFEKELDIDVCILCGGSASDLPIQTPLLAQRYCLVDSYDNHGLIPHHFDTVHQAALKGNTTALISAGWDPGLFSIQRVFTESILPKGSTETFWGKGVSQGHSDALRRIAGVVDAVQYTIPKDVAVEAVRLGNQGTLTTRDKHFRECFVVLKEGADPEEVRAEIVSMPHYFADYDSEVHFVSKEELARDHSAMAHGGMVLRRGTLSKTHSAVMEYHLELESNPEFTAAVLLAYARAVMRLHQEGVRGCLSVFDIAPKYLSLKTNEELRKELL